MRVVLVLATVAAANASEATPASHTKWEVISGTSICAVSADGDCVCTADANGSCADESASYGDMEACEIRTTQALVATAQLFETEPDRDRLTIEGDNTYSGSRGPSGVALAAGAMLTWTSDQTINYAGWRICASRAPPAPPVPPGVKWQVVEGSSYCHIVSDEQCISDGVGQYGNNEHCVFRALVRLKATATTFDTERTHDTLTLKGITFSGNNGPVDMQLEAGDFVYWRTDGSIAGLGFALCADGAKGPEESHPWDFSLPIWSYIMLILGVLMLLSFVTNIRRRRNMINAANRRAAIVSRMRHQAATASALSAGGATPTAAPIRAGYPGIVTGVRASNVMGDRSSTSNGAEMGSLPQVAVAVPVGGAPVQGAVVQGAPVNTPVANATIVQGVVMGAVPTSSAQPASNV